MQWRQIVPAKAHIDYHLLAHLPTILNERSKRLDSAIDCCNVLQRQSNGVDRADQKAGVAITCGRSVDAARVSRKVGCGRLVERKGENASVSGRVRVVQALELIGD